VMGLRGTGSNDVSTADVYVSEEHTIRPFTGPARHDGALFRLPFFTLAGVALVAFPLGVGRRALDEFAAVAETKSRPGESEPLARDATIQVAFARAEGALQGAHAFVLDAIGSIWDTACAGDVPSIDQRATLQLAAQQAMRAAIEAVDMSFSAVGGGAIHSAHPLQRCFRDLHAGAQHAYFSPATLKRYAKVRFGHDYPAFML
jgi:indole-3-acetate monooxygenase